MREEGKSIKQIKKEDYKELIELVGKKKTDEIFSDDEGLNDDTKYPVREIRNAILFARLKLFVTEHPFLFIIMLVVLLIMIWIYYLEISYYW